LEDEELQVEKVHTDDNWFDMIIKAISAKKLTNCCRGVGLLILLIKLGEICWESLFILIETMTNES